VGHSKGHFKREVYSHEYPDEKIRESLNNLVMYLKFLEKEEQANSKSRRGKREKEIIKIRAEINELNTKRMIQ
jgi:hypothetical protein